ncbi:RsmB/NOP family class I SAM-dependent RNA methyltransferase [Pseudotabrizicola algicola]|uniref:RsmB/NOP family class I SAM-dependent RNA methyltransferase n=1 Tax=Pseudotabrizicola algicola TaxID=2709381 RepID=A0A6B3RIN4_9RHOB|nr:RsmB/NOP family class I SAM-dependent RNA methyltransferase [Pseudotabrizicola algicola]NEX44973.1 RsmB/NOP family class I SAM-dependent RNA methyltransferase [Pseudotabrizicola algicola]
MTPAARLSAAIEVLDRILAGTAAEQALANWGRASRFAGSGDRLAVRDLVYDALRCRRSYAALGGGDTGRGLVLGGQRAAGADLAALFTGEGHAPAKIAASEVGQEPEGAAALDLPEWLMPQLGASLGADLGAVAEALRQRAPVFLRANTLRASRDEAIRALHSDGVLAVPHPLADTALQVMEGARKIQAGQAYQSGLVELQDAASQAVVNALPLCDGQRVLDLCAGGGGKTLGMAARARLSLFAHDAFPARMRDLPARARRAGAKVTLTETPEKLATFDLVLADAPCSGSGSWRRDPQGKWALTPQRLAQILSVQDQILDRMAHLVKPGGFVAYATCSLLRAENEDRIAAFLDRTPGWQLHKAEVYTPLSGGDGFFVALLTQASR